MLTTSDIPDDTVTGIDGIASDDTLPAETWYTIQGIRVNGLPSLPGLYVSDRRTKLLVR